MFAATATPAAAQLTASTNLSASATAVVSGETVTITVVFSNTGDVPVTNVQIVSTPADDCSTISPLIVQPGGSVTLDCEVSNVTEDFTNVVTASAFVPGFDITLTNGPINLLIEPGEYPGGNDEPGVVPSFNPPRDAVSLNSGNSALARAGIVLASLAAVTTMMVRRRQA